jgi:hypothetical protein
VLRRYSERYGDFGPTLAAVADRGGIVEGWPEKSEAPELAGERKRHFGEIVQMDGSIHDWFEGQREDCCLMNMVDDATATRRCRFTEEETTAGAMRLLWAWIERYGIPKALYTDIKNVYMPDERVRREAREEGREVFTQFGLACRQLGVRIIAATPQAKGRVERSHRVYQDRVVKELGLAMNQFAIIFGDRLPVPGMDESSKAQNS